MSPCDVDCGAVGAPAYRTRFEPRRPVPSRLTPETAQPAYERLRPFLALRAYPQAPGIYKGQWALFHQPGLAWWHEIRWMPTLQRGWRRLTFREFLEAYGIDGTREAVQA